jgi:Raf kinase inhibitor-like YbhB/YbcL family protein
MISHFFGRLMRNVRAGEAKLVWNHPAVRSVPATICPSSAAFRDGTAMPVRHAAKGIGDDESPPLAWSNIPDETAELVLIMEDPDAPLPFPSPHLLAVGISPHSVGMPAGALNYGSSQVRFGKWVFVKLHYRGPMPPPAHGPHRYVFQLFALDQALGTNVNFDRRALLREMAGKVLARGRLTGIYERT